MHERYGLRYQYDAGYVLDLSSHLSFFRTSGLGSKLARARLDHGPKLARARFGSVTGLVFGMTIGTWVHFLLLAIAVGLGINWNREVADAQERLQLERIKRGSQVNLYEENNAKNDDISNLETSDAAVDETLPLTFKI